METETKSLNTQPKENLKSHKRQWLDIVDIWLTLQGEGPCHGRPAIFIRTAGCNLDCPGCDTDYTSGRRLVYLDQIVLKVKELSNGHKYLVVITGGEPFRQNTIVPLCDQLIERGFPVQIETNGTYWQDVHPQVQIVCSPKTPKLHPKIIPRIAAYKYVIEAEKVWELDGLPTSVLGNGITPARPIFNNGVSLTPVYIAPADVKDPKKNEENLRAAIQSVFKFNYILSLQEQKLLGMP